MKERYTEEQIIGFLREADAGLPIKEGGLKSEVQHQPRMVCTWKNERSTSSFNPKIG